MLDCGVSNPLRLLILRNSYPELSFHPLPGPSKYVESWPFRLVLWVLGHDFTYFWCLGKPHEWHLCTSTPGVYLLQHLENVHYPDPQRDLKIRSLGSYGKLSRDYIGVTMGLYGGSNFRSSQGSGYWGVKEIHDYPDVPK